MEISPSLSHDVNVASSSEWYFSAVIIYLARVLEEQQLRAHMKQVEHENVRFANFLDLKFVFKFQVFQGNLY